MFPLPVVILHKYFQAYVLHRRLYLYSLKLGSLAILLQSPLHPISNMICRQHLPFPSLASIRASYFHPLFWRFTTAQLYFLQFHRLLSSPVQVAHSHKPSVNITEGVPEHLPWLRQVGFSPSYRILIQQVHRLPRPSVGPLLFYPNRLLDAPCSSVATSLAEAW
jgi:hypothetical protein